MLRILITLSAWSVLLHCSSGHAQTARFTIIDARNGFTADVQAAYEEAVGAQATSASIVRHIKLYTTTQHGFAAQTVDIPDHVKNLNISIDAVIRHGSSGIEPFLFNRVSVARHAPKRITQVTKIRGK